MPGSKYNLNFGLNLTMIRLLVGIVAIIQWSCATASEAPAWAYNPPGDSSLYLYGMGEGDSRDHAVKKALAEIGGKLGTSLKSDTTVRKTYSNNKESLALKENIEASVKEIEYSNYEVEQAAEAAGKVYALVRLDRGAMATKLKNQISQKQSELEQDFADFKNYSSLKKSQVAGELKKQINKVRLNAMIVKELTPAYDPSATLAKLNTMEDAFSDNKDSLEVLVTNDSNTEAFARKLEELLSQQGIKIAPGGSKAGKTVINVKGRAENTQFDIEHWTKLAVSIQVYDERGKMLKTYTMNEQGAGLSQNAALGQANMKLYNQFASKNMLEDLGL